MAEPIRQAVLNEKRIRERSGSEEIGARLKRARDLADMSGSELARHLGVSRSAVHQWESGDVAIDNRHVPAISTLLGIPVADLVTLPPGAEFLTDQERAILEELRRLSPERRESLLVILKGA